MQKRKLPNIETIGNIRGKRVLVRASFNVPVVDGVVTNQFRIMRLMPTLNYLRKQGAKVVIIAHIGRAETETLQPVHTVLEKLCGATWCPSIVGSDVQSAVESLEDGEVLLLENVRSDPREKQNDLDFAKELSSYADVYVNDAFAASHREHASVVGIPQYLPSYFGYNFIHEYEELLSAIKPQSPSLFILGGAKFDTKMPLIEKFTDTYTNVFVGGALANDFFRAKGYEIGTSLVSEVDIDKSNLMSKKNILLPIDVAVISDAGKRITTPDAVETNETILDAGPKTIEMLAEYIREAKMILWNGPLGDYENEFETETVSLAKCISDSEGYSVVGGGDTIASIEALDIAEKFNFLSTGGGAMLVLLEHGTLPAIEAVVSE